MQLPELRFTRARQAVHFGLLGSVCLAAAAGVWALRRYNHAFTPSLWWAVGLATVGLVCCWLTRHLAKHAYLLFSAIGIEIFPFFRPSRSMQLISWGEVATATVSPDGGWLTLSMAGYQDSKIIISLAPIPKSALPLLEKTIHGIMTARERAAKPSPP